MATCSECGNPVTAKGLCATHYQRARRAVRGEGTAKLAAPIRPRDLVTLPGARVSESCSSALEGEARRKGVPLYRVIGDVLEGWAKRRGRSSS